MTIKELKNNILLALYEHYKNGTTTSDDFDEFCSDNSINYDSERQLNSAFKSLDEQDYLKAIFLMGGSGSIREITPKGIEFVEENLLPFLSSTTSAASASGSTSSAHVEETEKSRGPVSVNGDKSAQSDVLETSQAYNSKENYMEFMDSSVEACFGITSLANCFVKQLDKIAEHTNDNFCMLGIFGPWGRGKTYFFDRIKDTLQKDKAYEKKYTVIEFNAWKYQDTPAIWAYLYETIYEKGLDTTNRCWHYIKYLLKKYKFYIISFIAFCVVLFSLFFDLSDFQYFLKDSESINRSFKISIGFIFLVVINFLHSRMKYLFSAYEIVEKYFKRNSYKGVLGIQNDLEGDLEFLVKCIIKKPSKKQIILYVDDIDRCETSKMLDVVNSLRLILENPIIQERMIVVCSIDANKLIQAYCEARYPGSERTKEQLQEAKQHLDKLFIFSVGLSPLDQYQQIEYLQKLYDKNEEITEVQPPFSMNRKKHSLVALNGGDEKIEDLTESKLGAFFEGYLKKNEFKELTPREIRIIYYRLLFANNILAAGDGILTGELLELIIQFSIDKNCKDLNIDTAFSDVIYTVVPY